MIQRRELGDFELPEQLRQLTRRHRFVTGRATWPYEGDGDFAFMNHDALAGIRNDLPQRIEGCSRRDKPRVDKE